MSPPEASGSTATGLEKHKLAEAQDTGFKINNYDYVYKDLKDDMTKCLNEDKGNIQSRNRFPKENPN